MAVCDITYLVRDGFPAVANAAMILFFWRKKRGIRKEGPEKAAGNDEQGSGKARVTDWRGKESGQASVSDGQATKGEAWLYVGKDDDGTPFYVDTESITCDPANPVTVRVWVKYKPSRTSQSFRSAEAFLKASRRQGGVLDHIRHRLEIDYAKKEIGDLELLFCAADGRLIDAVRFRTVQWKRVTPRSLYELVWKTADGIWRPDRFPFEPELRVKIQEKLWEINKAFETFETASEEKPKGS
jgi:hypothetical protein